MDQHGSTWINMDQQAAQLTAEMPPRHAPEVGFQDPKLGTSPQTTTLRSRAIKLSRMLKDAQGSSQNSTEDINFDAHQL